MYQLVQDQDFSGQVIVRVAEDLISQPEAFSRLVRGLQFTGRAQREAPLEKKLGEYDPYGVGTPEEGQTNLPSHADQYHQFRYDGYWLGGIPRFTNMEEMGRVAKKIFGEVIKEPSGLGRFFWSKTDKKVKSVFNLYTPAKKRKNE